MNCDGTESDISLCSATVGTNKHDCTSSEFAGVVCKKDSSSGPNPDRPHTNISEFQNNCKYFLCATNSVATDCSKCGCWLLCIWFLIWLWEKLFDVAMGFNDFNESL